MWGLLTRTFLVAFCLLPICSRALSGQLELELIGDGDQQEAIKWPAPQDQLEHLTGSQVRRRQTPQAEPSSNSSAGPSRVSMRILALFSGTGNNLGLDQRVGRQVLRLAASRARQLYPNLADLELIIKSDEGDCDARNSIPSIVAEQFYEQTLARECQMSLEQAGEPSTSGQASTCSRFELDLRDLDLYFNQSDSRQGRSPRRRHLELARSTGSGAAETPEILTGSETGSGGARTSTTHSAGRVDAILGPSCDFLVDLVARMAAYWRTPIYTQTSIGSRFSDKQSYPTLTRLSPSIDQLIMFMLRVMEHFKWRHLAVLADTSQVEMSIFLDNFEDTINRLRYMIPVDRKLYQISQERLMNSTISVPQRPASGLAAKIFSSGDTGTGSGSGGGSSTKCGKEIRETLLAARGHARLFLLLLNDPMALRRVLLCAHELRMNNGEYTFFALNLGLKASPGTSGGSGPKGAGQLGGERARRAASEPSNAARRSAQTFDWYSAEDEQNNLFARQMFESLMVFSVEIPLGDEFELFVEQTLEMAQQEFPNSSLTRGSLGPVAVALHDSLLLAVEAHLRDGAQLGGPASRTAIGWMGGSSSGGVRRITEESQSQSESQSESPSQLIGARPASMWGGSLERGLLGAVHVNPNGDQELDYVLSDLEPELGLLRPVATFGRESRQVMWLSGSYVHWPRRLDPLTGHALPGERAPPDEPECGFNNDAERCLDRQALEAALLTSGLVLLFVMGLSVYGAFKYRQISYERRLEDLWWKVEWRELQFVELAAGAGSGAGAGPAGSTVGSALGSAAALARALKTGTASVVSAGSEAGRSFVSVGVVKARAQVEGRDGSKAHDKRGREGSRVPRIVTTQEGGGGGGPAGLSEAGARTQASMSGMSGVAPAAAPSMALQSELSATARATNIALHKGALVVVKQLNVSSADVSRSLLVELKEIREQVHENLAKFVGLCMESSRVSVISEYCSRGSLHELLLNEALVMDWPLKYSILGDISNGLLFIHTSLGFHGRLKSTNLVLDSRFTVKITDYGLQSLYNQVEVIDSSSGEQDQEQDPDQERDQDEGGVEAASSVGPSERGRGGAGRAPDQLSLAPSAYRMESVSVRGGGGRGHAPGGAARPAGNRGAARFFWTAPEHLRARDAHIAGSKKGDIYAFGIILFELLARKEPYYFGTSAQPNWTAIRREQARRRPSGAAHSGAGAGAGLGLGQAPGGGGGGGGSSVGHRSRLLSVSSRGAGRRVAPTNSDVSRGATADSTSVAASQASAGSPDESSGGGARPSSALGSAVGLRRTSRAKRHSRATAASTAAAAAATLEEVEQPAGLHATPSQADGLEAPDGAKGAARSKRLEPDEILDQLAMGLQPEPARPYVPSFVALGPGEKLVELMRQCWSEAPQQRPAAGALRNSLRKVTKGQTAKNYLDNLLERLQSYAANLESIVDSKTADLIEEKRRTEEILYQLVPRFVADRLKRNETLEPRLFDGVTVFFSDIIGFEKYAAVMSPVDQIDLLNSIYASFESIISSFDVTKIETIIDQYLVAAGLSLQQENSSASAAGTADVAQPAVGAQGGVADPLAESPAAKKAAKLLMKLRRGPTTDSSSEQQQQQQQPSAEINDTPGNAEPLPLGGAEQVTGSGGFDLNHYKRSSAEQIGRMALCIRDLVKSFRFRQSSSSNSGSLPGAFNVRIGIHSGKVCTGIVGLKRPKYCLIGDTVNVASRMHTNSKANKIQISADTKLLLEQVPGFAIEPRGSIEIKGKGSMQTFWLESAY